MVQQRMGFAAASLGFLEANMALYARSLRPDELTRLETLLRTEGASDLGKRVSIVLLSTKHLGVQEISSEVGLHPINVRKWIHRFNQKGIAGLYPRRSPGRPRLFDEKQRQEIIRLAQTPPNTLGLGFSTWSLQRLRSQLIQRGIVTEISAEAIRQELLKGGLVFEERHWVPKPA
jgi:transposase